MNRFTRLISYFLYTTFVCLPLLVTAQDEKHLLFKYPTESAFIPDISYSTHGSALAVADGAAIKLFDTRSRKLIRDFTGEHRVKIMAVDLSKDSTLLLSGDKSGKLVLWDLVKGGKIHSFKVSGLITSVAIAPDNAYLAAGTTKRMAVVFDTESKEKLQELKDHTEIVTDVLFSPDGRCLATAGGDHIIHLYSPSGGEKLQTLNGHENWVRALSYTKDSKTLLSAGDDSKLVFWDITDLSAVEKKLSKSLHKDWIIAFDLNEDDQYYVYSDVEGSIEIFSPEMLFSYNIRMNYPVNKVFFKKNNSDHIEIVIATRGEGVFEMQTKNMKVRD